MTAGLPRFLAVDWNGTVVPWFGEAAYPDALSVLAELRRQGVRIAVVSHATPREICDDVARVGLEADEVHGVGAKASTLIQLANLWGDGVMIGDSPQDSRAAIAAGLPFIQASFGCPVGFLAGFARLEAWKELPILLPARSGAAS
jgi:phosphoglycolate phosphatase-like HAD superfamily hydrolase